MFNSNSAFDEPEYELPKVEAAEEKPEEDKSLHEAVLHDLNELADDLASVDKLNEEETRLLQERVENIRNTLYSTFS
jgi:hypothetical protein